MSCALPVREAHGTTISFACLAEPSSTESDGDGGGIEAVESQYPNVDLRRRGVEACQIAGQGVAFVNREFR